MLYARGGEGLVIVVNNGGGLDKKDVLSWEKAQEYEEGLGFTFFSINQSGGLDKNELCSLVSVGEKEEEEERVRVTVAPPPHHGPHGCPAGQRAYNV